MKKLSLVFAHHKVVITEYERGIIYDIPGMKLKIQDGDTSGIEVSSAVGTTIGDISITYEDNKITYISFVCEYSSHGFHCVSLYSPHVLSRG